MVVPGISSSRGPIRPTARETPSGVVAALDSPYTNAATPAVAVMAPGRSNRPARRVEAGSTRPASTATTSPIGTLTKNAQRQLA